MSLAVVTLKKGEGRTIKAGGMWIFDNEIASVMGTFENGDIVLVHDHNGYPMGRGFINTNSKIRIRLMTRNIDQEIDDEFLLMRVKNAWEYRKNVVDTGSCRMIFGEADFLPGIVIDKFEDVLVVESLALGIDRFKLQIVEACKKVLAETGITVRGVYERSDAKVRLNEGMERIKGFIGDEFDTKVQIVENGVKYYVDVKDGQKTGFFLDQKYNRQAIQKLCKGKKVLDCFTHTGSFALNAGIAGAESVLGVDASDLGVHQAEELAHLEMVGTIVHQLTCNLSPEEIKASGFDKYYVDHTLGVWPQAAGGIPFNACEFQVKGDPITDLFEDMAAEQKARSTYDNILRMIKDPDIVDPIRFLREREIVHFQRFGEALRIVQDELDFKNFYAFNPSMDQC